MPLGTEIDFFFVIYLNETWKIGIIFMFSLSYLYLIIFNTQLSYQSINGKLSNTNTNKSCFFKDSLKAA